MNKAILILTVLALTGCGGVSTHSVVKCPPALPDPPEITWEVGDLPKIEIELQKEFLMCRAAYEEVVEVLDATNRSWDICP